MEALNKKERNSAILRFSLWFLAGVIIICIPVILSSFLSDAEKNLSQAKWQDEYEKLAKEINFEKDTFALQVQTIMDLMKSKEASEIDDDAFNAKLMNLVSDIKKQTVIKTDWSGEMYRNTASIAEYLITANKIKRNADSNKDKQLGEMDNIILEFETCGDVIVDLCNEKNKKDFHQGINKVDKQFKKAIKMLNNYKSKL
ncbi:MAG: hypothetical protein LLG13_13295 [Bacteroidales bacterium]|nr:hypothetical protein [Bacteroidales bacterium]